MNGFNFKVGDKVYFPMGANNILTVNDHLSVEYKTTEGKQSVGIRHQGRYYLHHTNPSVFPATQEWYDKLVHVYPNLEKPPKRKTPKDIIQAMLASGAILIPCLVVDYDDNRILDYKKATRHCPSVLIYGISENGRFLSTNPHCSSYKYAVPFDIETGKVIIDFVDGQVIFEEKS